MAEKIGLEVLTSLLDKVPGVFWASRMDPATGKSEWLHIGQRMAEMYGVTVDEIRDDPNAIMKNIAPDDRAVLERKIMATAERLTPMQWAGRVELGNDQVRWVETHTYVERQPDGMLLWWGQILDVTERRRMEEALADSEAARAASENLFRQVINALPVGVMVSNQKFEFLLMNPVQEKMSGGIVDHKDQDVTSAYGVFMPDGKTPIQMDKSGLVRSLRGETLEEEAIIRNPRLEHDVRVHVAWTPLRDDKGQVFATLGTSQDITKQRALETERNKMIQDLATSEASRAASEALYRQVIDSLPVGVMVASSEKEFMIMNPKHRNMLGGVVDHRDGDVTGAYGIFMADGRTPLPMENSGLVRGLRGESLEEEVVVRNPRITNDVRMHVAWTPLRDDKGKQFAALGTTVDITTQRQLEAELRTRNEQLAASEEAKTELIERLRRAVDELSNPILEVWDGVLAMPIIGIVDSRRTADMVQRLLAEVLRMQASFVIIDLTGVDIVDTKTADHLMKLMKKVEVVGARCVLTGIRPAVAETLVDIGVDFGRLATLRNLKHGLGEALRLARRDRDAWRDYEPDDEDREERQMRRRERAGASR
ncbi:MAG: PAS domain-containing protein [Polyangiaceae bacterium]|nr:PAS domain-containing protein [Polyangiaceae bacterium]